MNVSQIRISNTTHPARRLNADDVRARRVRRQQHRTKGRVSFAGVNAAALPRLRELLTRWLPYGTLRGVEYVVLNPRREDRHLGSFCINTTTGKWADFATGDRGGDVISLAAYLTGTSQVVAARRLAAELGLK